LASDEFLNNALKWIRMAANNGNPDALCLLGRYLKKFRNNMSEGDRLLEKALLKLYPSPFPELQKNV
jgi:TPR repeat protein